MSRKKTILKPASEKQRLFLTTEADITVFGGAAGSGKSYLGVMDMLQYVQDPKFRGVMVRRTNVQLKGVGGLFDTASEMYQEQVPNVRIQQQAMKFTFPSGAQITMNHCEYEKDKHNFQGWQISKILVDEAQQWLESQIVYLISRLRSEANMKPQMKMTCNPDSESFLRRWLDEAGYLDENNLGIPKPEMDGKVRWFVRQGNDMIWADTEEELLTRYGKDCGALSFVFYAATCEDNPVLLKRDPTYLSKLKSLPRVEMLRLLKGAWHAKEEAAGLFKKEWVNMVYEHELPEIEREVRSWDLAASIPSEIYPDPDYTAGLKGFKDKDGIIYITDLVRIRARPAEVRRTIVETGFNDGLDVIITIPRDAGAAGKDSAERLTADLMSEGLIVRQKPSMGKGKAKRFEPVSALAENRMINVLVADWNKTFFDELENFGSGRGHDDCVDALSDLVYELITRKVSKPVTIPVMDAPTLLAEHRKIIQ